MGLHAFSCACLCIFLQFEYYTAFASYDNVLRALLDPVGNIKSSAEMSDNEQQRETGSGPSHALSEEDRMPIVFVRPCFGTPEYDMAL